MRQWLMDCLHCCPVRSGAGDSGQIINLECVQKRGSCRKKQGYDDKYFNDKGVCSLYKESYLCDKHGRKGMNSQLP